MVGSLRVTRCSMELPGTKGRGRGRGVVWLRRRRAARDAPASFRQRGRCRRAFGAPLGLALGRARRAPGSASAAGTRATGTRGAFVWPCCWRSLRGGSGLTDRARRVGSVTPNGRASLARAPGWLAKLLVSSANPALQPTPQSRRG